MPDTGSDMPDTGSEIPDTGSDMPDTGSDMPDTGSEMPDTGSDMPDTGSDNDPPDHPPTVFCLSDDFWMNTFKHLNLKDTKQLRGAFRHVDQVYQNREHELPVPDFLTNGWWLNVGWVPENGGLMCTASLDDKQSVHFDLSKLQLIQRYSRVAEGLRIVIDPSLPTAFQPMTAEYKKFKKHLLEECNLKGGHLAFRDYGAIANSFGDLFPPTANLKVTTNAKQLALMPSSFFSRNIRKFATTDAVTSEEIDRVLENNMSIEDMHIYCSENIPLRKYLDQWMKGKRTITAWTVKFERSVQHGFKSHTYERRGKKKNEVHNLLVKVVSEKRQFAVGFLVTKK